MPAGLSAILPKGRIGHSKALTEGWQMIGTAGYHFALCLGLTCAALLIPPLRSPALALVALAVPVLYFALRAEKDRSYRNSAAILASLLIFLTLFRSAFILMLFPESGGDIGRHDHYHRNAPVLLLLGLILMRQVGLGADRLLALLGGIASMAGLYFLLTALPGLSPFTDPIAAAWCAVGLGHAITLLTHHRSPVRTGLWRLLQCDEASWAKLRRAWGLCMQLAVQAAVFIGILATLFLRFDHLGAAALALGGASLLLHHSLIRHGRWHLWLATWQSLIAILLLAADDAHWLLRRSDELGAEALLAAWCCLFVVATACAGSWLSWRGGLAWLQRALVHPALWAPALLLGLLMLPLDSGHGVILALAWCGWLAAMPLGRQRNWPCWLLLPALALVILPLSWWQHWSLASGYPSLLLSNLALVLVLSPRLLGQSGLGSLLSKDPEVAALGWRLLASLAKAPMTLLSAALGFATLIIGGQVISQIATNHLPGWWAMGSAAVLAWLWYQEAKLRQRAWCLLLAQFSVALALAAGRQHLRAIVPDYDPAYDVWLGLALTVFIHGAKQWWQPQERWLRLPLAWSAAAVPLATLAWIWWQDMGSDLALISLALHCVGFSYVGGRDRHSPFLAMAIFSLVGLAVVAAWSNFGLRVLHAYTIPVGLGTLALVHLFRERLPLSLRHAVRAGALLVMLGSTAFHALLDGNHPLIFHFTLLAVGLAALISGACCRFGCMSSPARSPSSWPWAASPSSAWARSSAVYA